MRVIFVLPCLLVIADWLWELPLPLWAKLLAATLLLIASQYHRWAKLSSGSVFAPEFPRWLVASFNWGFGAIALLAVMLLGLDLGAVCVSLWRWNRTGLSDAVRLAAGAVAGLLAALGVGLAMRVPGLRDVRVDIAGLDPAFDGYRLLLLSDLHLSRLFPGSWAQAVVARANAASADMIVVSGDFIDGSVAMRIADIAPLAGLRAADGVRAVPGNHEYFFDFPAWMRHLSGLGIDMLCNAHRTIRRGDAALVVAGVTDRSAPGHGEAGPDLDAALAGAPAGAPIVLLDHQPGNARATAARGVALQLSGHTHGGMIVGLDRLVARGNDGFVSGRYEVGAPGRRMTLYVSNGTGLWPGFALRLGRPAEMTRFTLHRAPPVVG